MQPGQPEEGMCGSLGINVFKDAAHRDQFLQAGGLVHAVYGPNWVVTSLLADGVKEVQRAIGGTIV